jgi:hypothetical protein
MISPYRRHIKAFTLLLLVIQFCALAYGPVLFTDLLSAEDVSHAGLVCTHAESDSSHGSPDVPLSIARCLELDQPGLIASGLALHPVRVGSTLAASGTSALLPGFAPPIDFPPKYVA